MIEYTIRETFGVKSAESVLRCDCCGNGVKWGPGKCSGIPKGNMLRGTGRDEGWSIKKKHLCPICAAQNIKKKHEPNQTIPNRLPSGFACHSANLPNSNR